MYEPAQVNKVFEELNLKGEKKNFFSQLPWYLWLFLAVLILTIILILAYFLIPGLKQKITSGDLNIWTPPTSEVPEILGGKQSYEITGGTEGLPMITNVTLEPQDPKKKETQVIYISANNATPIKEVLAILHLDDNQDFEYKLDLFEGTNTNGTWRAFFPFPGTYEKAYRVTIKARNENNLGNMATISIR